MAYMIVKAIRIGEHPYSGPACHKAEVEPGKIYQKRWEAELDAVLLTKVNPVGFEVVAAP